MEKTDKISVRAYALLVTFFTVGTSILITPGGLAKNAKQDAWLACLLSGLIDVALVWLYTLLADRHEGQTLVQISRSLFGKWIGGAVGLAFAAFCYFLGSLLVGDMGYFLTTQVMMETPLESVMILFVIVVAIAVRQGMGVYSRAAEVLFPLVTFLFFCLLIPMFNKVDTMKLRPVLEFGFPPIVRGAVFSFSLQELAVLLMLYPYVGPAKGRKRAFLWGTAVGSLVLLLVTFGCLIVLEAALTANHLYPAYTLAKNIKLGNLLERVEGLLMFIWIVSIFFKTALCFHAALLGVSHTFGLREEKALVWPMALGLIPLGLMSYTNIVLVNSFLSRRWTTFSSVFLLVIPLLLLAVSLLRKRRSGAIDTSG